MSSKLANTTRSASKLLKTKKMPAFTLYGAPGSTNTDRVRLTLAEGGFTDYELVQLNLLKGEQKSPEHLARHPWGRVPVLTTPSGFTLYESRAICKYLCTKYSIPLLPPSSSIEATALFDQALGIEQAYFAEPAGKIGFEVFVKKLMGLPTDAAAVSQALQGLEAFFSVVERQLGEDEYMAGKEFTLVDVYYIPLVKRLGACGYMELVNSRPAVKAWWERCVNRPGIKALLAADEEKMKAAMAARAAAQ